VGERSVVEGEVRAAPRLAVWCAALTLAACGSIEPGEDNLQSVDGDAPPEIPPVSAHHPSHGATANSIPAGEPKSRELESLDVLGAIGDAFARPINAVERLLDPENLIPTVERSLARSIVRAARREYRREIEFGSREPEDIEPISGATPVRVSR